MNDPRATPNPSQAPRPDTGPPDPSPTLALGATAVAARRQRRGRAWLWASVATAVLVAGVSVGLVQADDAVVATGGPSVGATHGRPDATGDPSTSTTSTVDGRGAGGGSEETVAAAGDPTDGSGAAQGDEDLLPGTPGEITGHGSPGSPVSASIPPPVELAVVEPFAPAAPPAPEADTSPVDLLEAPVHGPIDDLVGNEPGCARSCLTTAMVTRSTFTTKLELQVETNVAAYVRVYISKDAPTITGGVPSFVGVSPVKTSGGHVTSWSGAIAGLDADTIYHVIIKATDLAGRSQSVTGPVRTTPQHDQLVAPGDGCTFQCITAGVATPTNRFDVVDLHITTSTPARLAVAVSTQEPGWIGGSPILPADMPVSLHDGVREEWNLSTSGLAPSTTYHVVVRATDLEGRYSSRIGSFTTAPEPPATVQVTLEHLTIAYDGDAADVNRGEVELKWGFGEQLIGHRSEEKMHDGTFIDPDSFHTTVFSVARGGSLPNTVVNAIERDADGHSNEGFECTSFVAGVLTEPLYDAPCDTRTSVAQTGVLTREQVEALPSCATVGLTGDKEDDRCALIVSPDLGDEYVRFWAVVSYRIS
jgi:hypothetical protein